MSVPRSKGNESKDLFAVLNGKLHDFISWLRSEPWYWKMFYAIPALVWILLPDFIPYVDDIFLILFLVVMFTDDEHAEKLEEFGDILSGMKRRK